MNSPGHLARRWLLAIAVIAALPLTIVCAEDAPGAKSAETLQERLAALEQKHGDTLLSRLSEVGTQIAEKKQTVLNASASMEQMKKDIETLKQEVDALKRAPAAVATPATTATGFIPPDRPPGLVITTQELAQAHATDPAAADKLYREIFSPCWDGWIISPPAVRMAT